MKKPLPVKIVEAIGWVYIALAVLLLFRAVIELPSVPATESICIGICFLVPTLLAVGMLVSLRRRRRGWFVVPNTMLLSLLVAGLALDSLDHASDGLVLACVVSSLFLIVPLVLLYLPSSTLWFKEKTAVAAESNGCLSVIGQFFAWRRRWFLKWTTMHGSSSLHVEAPDRQAMRSLSRLLPDRRFTCP